MSAALGEDAGEEAYEDYTLATPWERLTASLEDSLTQWLAAGPAGLVDDGGAGSDTGGAAPLRVTTVSVPYFLPTHTQAYKLHLHFQSSAATEWPAYSLPDSAAFQTLPLQAHPVTRSLGCSAFVLCTSGAGEPVADEDEACAVASALACAATHVNAPWPVLLATHGPVRLRGSVYDPQSGTLTRLESAAVEASRPALWAASVEAQLEALHARVAATGSAIDASPHEWASEADCRVSMRHCLPLPDAHGVDIGAGDGRGRALTRGSDEEEDDTEDVGIAGSHMQLRQRSRAQTAHDDTAWDASCPWSPWVSLLPPFDSLQLVGCWERVPATDAIQAAEAHLAPEHPATATNCLLRAVLAPHLVPSAPAGAEWTGVGREQLSGQEQVAHHRGDGDDGGEVTSPSLATQLQGLAVTLSAVTSAESMGALASGDWFEAHGDGGMPPAPPEHVLQDVLRDILDAPPLPVAWNATGRVSHGAGARGRGVSASGADASQFASLPRCCPPDELLARVALHALTFGNARAVALLWTRVLRELRFTHWETGVLVPRMGAACSAPDGVPDMSSCLAHQKLQMLNICMARRAEEAAHAAAAAADAQEQAANGVTTQLEQARTADAAAAAVAKRQAAGWEQAWEDDDDGFETASDGEGESDDTPKEEAPAPTSQQPGVQQGAAEAAAPLYPAGPPRGVAQALPWRLCMWPHMKANEPRTLRPAVMTEDMLRDRDLALAALSLAEDEGHEAAARQEQSATAAAARARLQAGPLLSDMSAFKAANLHQGGGTLGDFVRWHSPRDWVVDVEEGDDAAADAGTSKTPGAAATASRAPKGRLSDRMAVRDGLWAQLWAQAPPLAAAEQKPLQDACAAGEAALHSLEMMPPADVFASLLACGAAAVGALLDSSEGSALPSASGQLHAAARTCAAVLQRPCPFTDEWLAMCDAVAAAERSVSAATWLHRHLGSNAPRAAESVLRALLAQPAASAVEVEFHDSPDGKAECEALLGRLPQAGGPPPVLSEWVLTAVTAAAGGPPRSLAHRLYTRVEAGRVEMGVAVQR